MNSNERHQIRYIRRKAKRNINRQNKGSVYDDFEQVFSWENLYQSYKQCCLGVSWKHSTQLYKINSTLNITKTYKELKDGKFKPKGFNEFTINERGKVRHIKSIHLSERVIQKCLCDYSLIPMLSPSFIYDNGACLKGKGIDFTLSRLKRHLQQFYRIYGNDGYILVFDFSKYFDTIQHDILKAEIAKQYTDKRLIDVINKMIDSFGGECGLGLGSQISQICALYYPNKIDHIVKEQLRINY